RDAPSIVSCSAQQMQKTRLRLLTGITGKTIFFRWAVKGDARSVHEGPAQPSDLQGNWPFSAGVSDDEAREGDVESDCGCFSGVGWRRTTHSKRRKRNAALIRPCWTLCTQVRSWACSCFSIPRTAEH